VEPFDTFRAEPRRFAVGLPLVFGGSLVAALLVVSRSLTLALAVLLLIQTGGVAALYVPALRRRLEGSTGDETPPSAENFDAEP
jgi:hypothetical protein